MLCHWYRDRVGLYLLGSCPADIHFMICHFYILHKSILIKHIGNTLDHFAGYPLYLLNDFNTVFIVILNSPVIHRLYSQCSVIVIQTCIFLAVPLPKSIIFIDCYILTMIQKAEITLEQILKNIKNVKINPAFCFSTKCVWLYPSQ